MYRYNEGNVEIKMYTSKDVEVRVEGELVDTLVWSDVVTSQDFHHEVDQYVKGERFNRLVNRTT